MLFRRELGAGLVVALVMLLNSFAYASLLASGPIATLLPTIMASAFLGTAVTSLILARFYSLPSVLAGPAGSAAVVAGAALSTVVAHARGSAVRSADVAVVLALTALLPGIVLFVLWRFRLGRAIRFVPYPVLAGFLAGTGWLSIVGSARVADARDPFLAAVAFVVVLRLAHQRWKSPWIVPLAVAGATAIEYGALAATHLSLDAARAGHWIFPRLPAAGPSFISPAALQGADWSAIAGAWSTYVWLIIVVILVSMLNSATLEVETQTDADLDGDLLVFGGANIAAGLGGGFGSQVNLPASSLASKLAPRSRLPGYVVAGVFVVAIVAGGPVIPFLPKPVFAGLIAFIGVRFLEQYAWTGIRTMPRLEAAAVVAMLVCTGLAGLQAALVLGLLLACIAFISNASRQQIVRRHLTLRTAHSRVEHTLAERRVLETYGDGVDVITLQGQLFFGSANALYETLKPIVETEPRRTAIVLDLAFVYGIDLSAALSLNKLAQKARRRGTTLVFASVSKSFVEELRRSGVLAANDTAYAHLDEALEACEAQLLKKFPNLEANALVESDLLGTSRNGLGEFVERVEYADGEVLFRDGESADALYVLVHGRLSVQREDIHLRTLLPGTLVGEMGFFTGESRSATVTALETAVVERLSLAALRQIERERPDLLLTLHRSIVRLQADRLRSANAETIAFHA